MKSFGDWFNQDIKPLETPEDLEPCTLGAHECLIDNEGGVADEYPCVVCDEYSEIYCEPHEFDPDMHYCGGSPSCCP